MCAVAKNPLPGWLLVKKHINNIGIPLDVFGFLLFQRYFGLCIFFVFLVFANQPTVHNSGFSRERVCGRGVSDKWPVTDDMRHIISTWHVTHDTWHNTCNMCHVSPDSWLCFCSFWYRCCFRIWEWTRVLATRLVVQWDWETIDVLYYTFVLLVSNKYSQSSTGVVKDDVLPVQALSAHCPVAGRVCCGKDRSLLSSPSVVRLGIAWYWW